MLILAGDIGGTKTLLQLARRSADASLELLHEARLPSSDFTDLESLIEAFLDQCDTRDEIDAACLAIAGPVDHYPGGQRSRLTNLPWQIDSAQMALRLNISQLRLINDFQAVGYAIEGLSPEQLHCLQAGNPIAHAPRLVVGAGTGLGVCLLIWSDDHYEALPTEGGHISYAAQNAEQEAVRHALHARYGRVSVERVVSGGALPELYSILHATLGSASLEPVDSSNANAAASIASRARAQSDPAAVATLRVFLHGYASTSADLALASLARGGVYLAGGVTPKLLDLLQQPDFLSHFHDKGRMRPIVESLPVHAVLEERCGLLGALSVAARLATANS